MNDADLKSAVNRYTKQNAERFEAARDKVSDALKSGRDVSSFELEELITSETHARLWESIGRRHAKGQPLSEALDALKSLVEERIWNETPMNSTSVMANAMQVVQISAQKRWVDVATALVDG